MTRGLIDMAKTIQIPLETFLRLYKVIVLDLGTEDDLNMLKSDLGAKFDAIVRRETYTTYKTAQTDTEREKARQKYLDIVGVPEDFRW